MTFFFPEMRLEAPVKSESQKYLSTPALNLGLQNCNRNGPSISLCDGEHACNDSENSEQQRLPAAIGVYALSAASVALLGFRSPRVSRDP